MGHKHFFYVQDGVWNFFIYVKLSSALVPRIKNDCSLTPNYVGYATGGEVVSPLDNSEQQTRDLPPKKLREYKAVHRIFSAGGQSGKKIAPALYITHL